MSKEDRFEDDRFEGAGSRRVGPPKSREGVTGPGSLKSKGKSKGRDLRRGFSRSVSFVWEYTKTNLTMEMEYRAAFVARLFGMVLNDCMWLTFWIIYFTRFPVVQGWTKNDIVTLWAVCGLGYGLAHGIFGNTINLSSIIASGNLDFYLAYPRNVLLHALCSKVDVTSLGDVVFGPLVLIVLVRPSLLTFLLYLVSGVLVGCIFVGFTVLAGTIAFFVGNSENLASQVYGSLIHFSTYPSAIFNGAIKVVLFTLIPAGFINSVPVMVIRDFDPVFFVALVGVAAFFLWAANYVFKLGLRRYESGNLMQVRM